MLSIRSISFIPSVLLATLSLSAAAHSHPSQSSANPDRTHWGKDHVAYRMYREHPRLSIPRGSNGFRGQSPARRSLIHSSYLIDALAILSGEKHPVLRNRGGKAGKIAAREFLKAEFESFGFTVYEHAYRTGVNLVAERPGQSGKFLVVSAHYDSLNNAGADDDGTGVVSMLATARMLQGRPLQHGVRFVAFDEEEKGLIGSAAYVKDLVAQGEKGKIIGNLQMEMMGYNRKNDGKFHVITCGRTDSQFFLTTFQSVVARLGTGLQITETCTDRSDHASFWKHGIPAVVISENFFGGDDNPCYHRACDKMDIMNLSYYQKVAEASAGVVGSIVLGH